MINQNGMGNVSAVTETTVACEQNGTDCQFGTLARDEARPGTIRVPKEMTENAQRQTPVRTGHAGK